MQAEVQLQVCQRAAQASTDPAAKEARNAALKAHAAALEDSMRALLAAADCADHARLDARAKAAYAAAEEMSALLQAAREAMPREEGGGAREEAAGAREEAAGDAEDDLVTALRCVDGWAVACGVAKQVVLRLLMLRISHPCVSRRTTNTFLSDDHATETSV